MSASRIGANAVSSPERLSRTIENLVIAFAVAHIGTSVEALERCLAEGKGTRDDLAAALDAELRKDTSGFPRFTGDFELSLRHELEHVFGQRAGDVVARALEPEVRSGDITRLLRALPELCRRIHRPLKEFLAAQRKTSQQNARLIRAIADEGIESIDAFKLIENLQAARSEARRALEKLESAC